ncbi:MAG: hypothetical protein KDC24_09570 [Saprospiraceae bacterium]|nr:hypothetical protein [Saprospiraceae bacterium]
MKSLPFLSLSLIFPLVLGYSKPLEKSATKANIILMDTIRIVIQVGDTQIDAMLFDNPTTRSFLKQFPLTVTVEDHAGTEKIFYPKPPLDKKGAPDGAKPVKGDIMYYAPWDDVAIFYKSFRYAPGLIPMGNIQDVDALVEALQHSHSITFKIK